MKYLIFTVLLSFAMNSFAQQVEEVNTSTPKTQQAQTKLSSIFKKTEIVVPNKKDSTSLEIEKSKADAKDKFELRKNSIFKLGGNSGGGGARVGIEFVLVLEEALLELKKVLPNKYALINEKNLIDMADKMKVLVVDESLDAIVDEKIQNSELLNFPELSTVVIDRLGWKRIQNYNLKKGLALHEFLSLLRMESTGSYSISAKYLIQIGTDPSLLTGSTEEVGLLKPRGLQIQTSTNIQELSEKIEKSINAFCAQWIKSDKNRNSFLIRTLTNIVVEVDVYRSSLELKSKARELADQARDELDFLQLKFVKKEISQNSVTYNELENLMTQFCK